MGREDSVEGRYADLLLIGPAATEQDVALLHEQLVALGSNLGTPTGHLKSTWIKVLQPDVPVAIAFLGFLLGGAVLGYLVESIFCHAAHLQ